MDLDLSAFHFLRPWWLLVLPLAGLLGGARRGERASLARGSGIAAELLPYLTVRAAGSRGPRPIDLLAAMMALGALALAGPAWERDEPAYLDNVAPLIVAVDLSPSMDGADVPPTRLEAAKHTVRDLAARRAGAKTGLIAYAGSSHLVLPPTDDGNLLDLFAQALSTDLTDNAGRDAAGAIALAARVLQAERAGGTLLLLTDGVDTQQLDPVREHAQAARDMQVLLMAVGQAGLDADGLRDLAGAAGASLGSLTGGPDDLDWIALHAQQHFRVVQDAQSGQIHWKDAGYWLCWPLALLALLAVRRGWNVAWAAGVLIAVLATAAPPPAQAGPVADAFLTADQQGRLAFEQGRYEAAAAHFRDPYWKGRAAYQAGNYKAALNAFSTLPTAEGYFYAGNTQVRLHQYDAALAAYDQALALKPDWQPAMVNRDIVARLLDAMSQEQQGQPVEPPDRSIQDKSAQAGKMTRVQGGQALSEDAWLRNLTVSPARFLRGKFAAEDAAKDAAGVTR
ncbi:vWA domain-containing protein [Bordetella petrii]|uniref:vWA domain-containing protein n=1 Tax=Bordetella petrii TaxID=94624 RepID=UPI001E465F3A|nr:VWA domain-containing protein [Bordetella petrii]MCD0506048.1 VWA domain-containing protein [Bordetella petrii]